MVNLIIYIISSVVAFNVILTITLSVISYIESRRDEAHNNYVNKHYVRDFPRGSNPPKFVIRSQGNPHKGISWIRDRFVDSPKKKNTNRTGGTR